MNNMAKGKSNHLKRLLNSRSSSTNTSQRKARWKDLLPLLFMLSAIGFILSYGQISSNDKSEILDSYLEGAPPPIPHKDFWEHSYSIEVVRELVEDRMFPLSVKGLEEAMTLLTK